MIDADFERDMREWTRLRNLQRTRRIARAHSVCVGLLLAGLGLVLLLVWVIR